MLDPSIVNQDINSFVILLDITEEGLNARHITEISPFSMKQPIRTNTAQHTKLKQQSITNLTLG
jgi:hypothetical protein